jgi:hypothetical protein
MATLMLWSLVVALRVTKPVAQFDPEDWLGRFKTN